MPGVFLLRVAAYSQIRSWGCIPRLRMPHDASQAKDAS